MIVDSCLESARGHGWFYYLNERAVLIACQNSFTPFLYKVLALRRAVLFFLFIYILLLLFHNVTFFGRLYFFVALLDRRALGFLLGTFATFRPGTAISLES